MAGEDLGIPFEALEEFGGELDSIKNRMNGLGRTFDSYEEDLGDSGVVEALDSFVDNWRDGRAEIDEQLTSLKDMTQNIITFFTDVDGEYAAELQSGGSDGGGQQQPV
ncbi:hypothetical protein [Streptomyces carpaticus]|uniref:WXG100 family type VII secretion target n=1 Tax=Streptomyces carpaticus TaxID=285558 RepID=A0ABV4ZK56_9ACTN